MSRIRWYGPTLVMLVVVLLVMLAGPGVARKIVHAQAGAQIQLVKSQLADNPTLAELSHAFRKVAEVVEPSVVHIEVRARNESPRGRSGSPNQFWERFFGPGGPPDGMELPDLPQQAPEAMPDDQFDRYNPALPYGNGSGWVYDDAGHIITNNHVVRKRDGLLADEILVRFHDGSERNAKVVGTDPRTDVAVIRVEGDNLHPATIADEPVEQGDIVFAFGSPFRFEFSMSQGIVSGKGRQLGIIRNGGYENFIQTDAAINPGNSGGPLTNIYGQVIGMNTAIATATGAYNGLGFAIPTDMVVRVADQLIDSGKVSRGYLGIFIEDLDEKMARTFGFTGKGVLVVNPIKGGPAAAADIRKGDIVTRVNDKAVTTADELRNRVAAIKPGSTVSLELFRDGKLITTDVEIAELPDQPLAAGGTSPSDVDASAKELELLQKLGVQSARALTDADVKQLKLDDDTQGVLVLGVRRGSVAQQQGINRGSIITDVMGEQVDSVESLVAQLKKHDLAAGVRVSVLDRSPDGEWLPRFVLLDLASE